MVLAALVTVSLFAGATTVLASHPVETTENDPFDHELSDANNSSVSLHYEGDGLVLDNAKNQTIRGNTTLDPGTELGVQLHATGQFYKSQTVMVRPNGTFNATFDLDEYKTGTEFGAIVTLPGNNSTETKTLLVVDGVLRNDSMTTTTERPTTTYALTETATASGETTDKAVVADAATETTQASDSSGQPGFSFVVALVALAGAGLLLTSRD